jgi:hypothetical protein
MIASLALQNPPDRLKILLIDPRDRGYRHYAGLPNLVCPVVTDPTDGLHRLKWAARHVERRLENRVSSPSLVIFVDELADLVMVNARETGQVINYLLQGGGDSGIHLVVCTQKPAIGMLAEVVRGNFPTRIVGKVNTLDDARAASGLKNSGAERLMGKGDFLLFTQGETTRLQAAHISNVEMEQTVLHLGGMVQQQSARPERSTLREADPASYYRSFERQQPQYEDENQNYQAYNQRRAVGDSSRVRRENANYGKEAMGITERLATYEQRIRASRGTKPTSDMPTYNPVREQTKAKKTIKAEVADSEFEEEVPTDKAQKKTSSTRSPRLKAPATEVTKSQKTTASENVKPAAPPKQPENLAKPCEPNSDKPDSSILMQSLRERLKTNLVKK